MGLKIGGQSGGEEASSLEEGDLPLENNRPPGGQMMKSLWSVVPQNKGAFKGLVGREEEGGRGEDKRTSLIFSLLLLSPPLSFPHSRAGGVCILEQVLFMRGPARDLLKYLNSSRQGKKLSPFPQLLIRN